MWVKTNPFALKMKPYLKYLAGAVLFIAFFCGYYFLAPHVLYFQEQHHLFLWTSDYWSHMAHLRGWAYPLMAFIIQFSYYPALGAAVWALLLVAIFFMLQSIVYRLSGYRDLLQLTALVPIWLFSTGISIDIYPIKPVEWGVWIFGVWIVALIVGRFLPWTRKAAVAAADMSELAEESPAKPQKKQSGVIWLCLSVGLPLIYLALGFNLVVKEKITGPIHQAERTMLMAEKAVREERWDDALELSDGWLAGGAKNHLMSYFRSLALYQTGGLYDHLFDRPQTFGIRALFFPWRGDKNQAEHGHYVYQYLGHINEAHRWVFEALVGWGETAPLLTHLIEYNIVMGRPLVADKFLCQLEQSTFYRDKARSLRQCLEKGEVPGMRYAMANASPDDERWNNVINIGGETRFILNVDPQNEMARQYLILAMMLVGNSEAVVRNLQELYPASENPELPRVVQEALLMYRMTLGHDFIDSLGYNLSEENQARFRAYMVENAKGKKANFTPEMRRTYWYYVQHILPGVNHDFSRIQAQIQS